MDAKLKKRIVGILLLLGAGLIIAPIFFSHSVNTNELKLSSRIPQPPARPSLETTIKTPASVTDSKQPRIVFEELQSIVPKDASNNSMSTPSSPLIPAPSSSNTVPQLATTVKPVAPIMLTTASPQSDTKASIVPLSSVPAAASAPDTATPSLLAPATKTASPSSPENTADVPSDEDALPDADEDTSPEPTPVVKTTSNKTNKAKVTINKPKTKPAVADKTHKTTHGTPATQAWAVQLGSFSDKINAQKLMKSLQSQGYAAYVQIIKTSHGSTMTKVLVGPELRRADAEKIQEKLKALNAGAMLIKVGT